MEQNGHEEVVWKREEVIQALVHALRRVFMMEGGVVEGRWALRRWRMRNVSREEK